MGDRIELSLVVCDLRRERGFGRVEDLPFDLGQQRILGYEVAPDASAEVRSATKASLVSTLLRGGEGALAGGP